VATRVLVVDDDPTVSNVVSAYLTKAGYDARVVADGVSAVEVWQQWKPSVVVLDVMLPGLSGLEGLRRMRAADDGAAVIMLSARGEEEDRLVGLEVGADDYVSKPYRLRELVARIRAALRRAPRDQPGASATLLEVGDVRLDPESHEVFVRGDLVTLPLKEFELLEVLLDHAGRVVTRDSLIDRVWGPYYVGDTKTLDVHVKRLRSKIEEDPSTPRRIVTIRGLGYKYETSPK
jgi:DNA-binding response OmpR family regulator